MWFPFASVVSSSVDMLTCSRIAYDNLVKKKRCDNLNNGLNIRELKCGKFQLMG